MCNKLRSNDLPYSSVLIKSFPTKMCFFFHNSDIIQLSPSSAAFIIIIIIIIIIMSFMQGIYTYIPETNYVPREYSVAASLFFYSWCLYR